MSNERLKILVVAESINVNDSSATKGRVALIKNLAKAGFQLKVYHYTRNSLNIENIVCIEIPEQRLTIMYFLSKIQLLLWRWFKVNMNPFFEKLFGFSFSYFNDVHSITKALKRETSFNPDWVLTLSKAASFRTHKALLNLPKWHDKWLAYVHDPFPHHFYPRPYNWVAPGYYQKQEFFREVSKKSIHGIFPSLLLMEWMGSYYPDFLERGAVIPHQIADGEIKSHELPDYFNEKHFNVLHAGSLMKQRDPKGLIEGFASFLDMMPEAEGKVRLLLLGKHEYFETYLQSMEDKHSWLYVSKGYVNFENVLELQYAASVNVILEAKTEISPFLPGKFPHCVQANKPILYLGPTLSETARLLACDYPYKAEIDQANAIAQHLKLLYSQWKNAGSEQSLNRPDLEQYLSYTNLKDVIVRLT